MGIGGGKTPGLDPAAEIQQRNDEGPEPGCGSRDREMVRILDLRPHFLPSEVFPKIGT